MGGAYLGYFFDVFFCLFSFYLFFILFFLFIYLFFFVVARLFFFFNYYFVLLIIPRHTKVAGYYGFTLVVRVSVRLPVRPSVLRPSVRPFYLSG